MFAPGSPRFVACDQAQRIVQTLPPFVEPVGVFLDHSMQYVYDTASRLGLRTVQLHGKESPEQAMSLAPLRVIKAISFDSDDFEAALKPWRNVPNLEALLLDAPHRNRRR